MLFMRLIYATYDCILCLLTPYIGHMCGVVVKVVTWWPGMSAGYKMFRAGGIK